jgi:NADH dehydrogenase [ubiquinone] 1 alpha subcomplex assembly factor 6
MPNSSRNHGFALRAFNVEVASIKSGSELYNRPRASDLVEISIGQRMRFQWWREALEKIYKSKVMEETGVHRSHDAFTRMSFGFEANPVFRALDLAVQDKNLTRRFLERLLDSREVGLAIQQLDTMNEVIQYAEESSSSLLYLSLECCGVRDNAADEVASDVGIALGIVTAIRSICHRAEYGEMAIPKEILPQPIPAEYLISRHNPEFHKIEEYEMILHEAVQHMAYTATQFLIRARASQSEVPKQGREALLPAIAALHYLEKLKEVNYNVFDDKLYPEQGRLVFLTMLGRAWLTGKF